MTTGPEDPRLLSPDDAAFDAAMGFDNDEPEEAPSAPVRAVPAPAEASEEFAPAEFDERHRQPFTGLLYLGHLEETFSIWGHTFRIVTPSRMERLQAGELHAPYVGTLAAEIAYETVMVAAFLVEVDGHELPKPVIHDPKENAVRDRFKWVSTNLKEPVIGRVYELVLRLDQQVRDVMDAMGEA